MEPTKSEGVEGTTKLKTKAVQSTTQDLKETVKARLVEQNLDIKETVVAGMVIQEKNKRVGLLERAFEELGKLEGEFKKIQPDIFSADEKGSGLYSSEVFKKRQKLEGDVKKLEAALERAVNEKDWNPLKEFLGNLPK